MNLDFQFAISDFGFVTGDSPLASSGTPSFFGLATAGESVEYAG